MIEIIFQYYKIILIFILFLVIVYLYIKMIIKINNDKR